VVVSKAKKVEKRVRASQKVSKKGSTGNTAAKRTTAKEEVVMDRRGQGNRRGGPDRRKKTETVAVECRKLERRVKVNRRRQIDPTTCERDYSLDEVEFMTALDNYKRTSGRMFPTCSEILEVLRKLGYVKLPVETEIPSVDTESNVAPEAVASGVQDLPVASEAVPV
jgi:hypothetical protein